MPVAGCPPDTPSGPAPSAPGPDIERMGGGAIIAASGSYAPSLFPNRWMKGKKKKKDTQNTQK